MPSLKALRNRIGSVKSTQKITRAMKMVAAAKLRRAEAAAEAARPYASRMREMMAALSASVAENPDAPKLLVGTGRDKVHLIVAVTADRGLCGPFNSQIGRAVRNRIRALEADGKTVKVIAVGRKGRDYLRREFADRLIADYNFVGKKTVTFEDAEAISKRIIEEFESGGFDVCTLVYNHFVSVMVQQVQETPLVPAHVEEPANDNGGVGAEERPDYEVEPEDGTLLERLLPRNLAVQMFHALLESAAGEQGARMTAMDNATRNAGEMIDKLTLNYNRTRQANITKELIEIISGAEAL